MATYVSEDLNNPELYFQCKLYTGNGSNDHAQTFDGDENMQPNMVWIKGRSVAENHHIFDSVRGANKRLIANNLTQEFDDSSNLQSFDSNGFTLGTADGINKNTATFVCWGWKESATAGFDIVTYTGNGSGTRGISHSLSAVPHCFIVKGLASSRSWPMYHHTLGNTKYGGYLDSTGASGTYEPFWADTTPTSSVFTVDTDSSVNANTENYVAYLWSEKQGFSKFGTYTGSSSADGPYIYLGFKPAWFMTKKSNGAKDWNIFDNKRSDSGGGNANDQYLEANTSAAEQSGQDVDFLSTGVKIRSTSSEVNGDDNNFIYMAFAESPLVNSNGVPNNAE